MVDNRKRILEKLARDQTYWKEADTHQALLNVGYDEWEKNKQWDYTDMLDWIQNEYGNFMRFAILTGKFNHQIENGGFFQYIFNAYSGREKNSIPNADIPLHKEMICLLKAFGLCEVSIGKKVYDVMKKFEPEIDTDEYREEEGYDAESDQMYYDEVENEDYGCIEQDNLGTLDAEYYTIKNKWMDFLNRLFASHLTLEIDNFYDFEPKIIKENTKKPKVKIIGENGNAFNLIAIVKRALIRAGLEKEAEEFVKEATSDDYNFLLATCVKYVDVY